MNAAAKARFIIPALGLLVLGFWLLFQYTSPVVHHHNTAHIFMLNTLEIWDEESPATYHFAPVQTWPGAEKHNHYYKRLEDAKGNNYYISHPPAAFLLNYGIIKMFGLPVNQSSLQYILIFLFLTGALFLAWIARYSIPHNEIRFVRLAMLAAMAIYILNPVNLYAHSQHNFSEIWGQFFLITSLAAWVHYLRSDRVVWSRILLMMSVFLLAATDWMGITFCAALLLVYIRQMRKPHIRSGFLYVMVAAVAALMITGIQYSSIAGNEAFVRALGIRFLERSGYFGATYTDMGYHVLNPETWLLFLQQIHQFLSGPGYLIAASWIVCMLITRRQRCIDEPGMYKTAFWTAAIFFILLFSAGSIHYIYSARFTPFLALAAAGLFIRLRNSRVKPVWFLAAFIFCMHLAAFWSTDIFHKSIPAPDKKQIQLNAAAKLIQEEKRNSISLQKEWEESDIIYLSYQSKRNLVWEK